MIGELFSTFLPSLLMLVVSHLSSTFRCPFKVAVLLNLACLLVVTMLSYGSLLRQPSKSSFNMVDIWLFVCYLTIISRIVLLMAIQLQRVESKTSSYQSNKVRSGKFKIRPNISRLVMSTKGSHWVILWRSKILSKRKSLRRRTQRSRHRRRHQKKPKVAKSSQAWQLYSSFPDTILVTAISTGAVASYIFICVLHHFGIFSEENWRRRENLNTRNGKVYLTWQDI